MIARVTSTPACACPALKYSRWTGVMFSVPTCLFKRVSKKLPPKAMVGREINASATIHLAASLIQGSFLS